MAASAMRGPTHEEIEARARQAIPQDYMDTLEAELRRENEWITGIRPALGRDVDPGRYGAGYLVLVVDGPLGPCHCKVAVPKAVLDDAPAHGGVEWIRRVLRGQRIAAEVGDCEPARHCIEIAVEYPF